MTEPIPQPITDGIAEPMTHPSGNPSMRVRVDARASSSSSSSRSNSPSPTNVVERRGWDGQADFEGVSAELRRRGVNAGLRTLLTECSLAGIVASIEWWDGEQDTDHAPGPGALVETIRRGGVKTQAQRLSSEERNQLYADGVCDWLMEHFPDLERDQGRPHPAAVTCVFRLHHRDGKGSLTKARHEREIRAAVREFDKRFPTAYPKEES